MMRTAPFALAALLLACPASVTVVHAQTTAPAPAAGAANGQISDLDRKFLVKDAQGSLYEQALAELAQKRATRGAVKDYAAKVVSDHETANQSLQDLATFKNVTLPTTMTAADQRRLKGMEAHTKSSFDAAFIKEAIRINSEDKQASASETAHTQDSDIKAFLDKFSSMDADHEKMALALRG